MGNLVNPVHGQKEPVRLAIESVGTKLTGKGKIVIAVIPDAPYAESAVWLTPEHLEQWAEKKSASDRVALANAINLGDDTSYIHAHCVWKQEGERIGNNPDGTPIIGQNGTEYHSKSYWEIDLIGAELELGVDATANVQRVNDQVDIAMAIERRKALKAGDIASKQERIKQRFAKTANKPESITTPEAAVNTDEAPI